jgi:hypothetical protein
MSGLRVLQVRTRQFRQFRQSFASTGPMMKSWYGPAIHTHDAGTSPKRGNCMDRRKFLAAASATMAATALHSLPLAAQPTKLKPMALGLLVSPFGAPEATIRRVHDLGFSNCFLSLDGYIGGFTPAIAAEMKGLLEKYDVTATTVEVVGPKPLVWDFLQGPSTIGLVPPATRAARIDALRQVSDLANML